MKPIKFSLYLIGTSLLIILLATTLNQLRANTQGTHIIHLPLISKPVAPPQITLFTATPPLTDPGDTIEIAWQTENATSVTLYHLLPTLQLGQFWEVEANGSMTYTISASTRNFERFYLVAVNDDYPYVDQTISITLNCPHHWFFAPAPDVCAQDAVIESASAEQHFEHGVMIWVEEEDRIYILYDDNQSTKWEIFTDEWEDGDPINDPTITPPTDYFQPERGFGLVWREGNMVRDRLGWAITTEAGYQTNLQRTSYAKYNEIYIEAQNGTIWRLLAERSGWEIVIPTD